MGNGPFDDPIHSTLREAGRMAGRLARVPMVHIIVRQDKCIGCKKCVRQGFCRFGAISVMEKKARIDDNRCRGCMRCTHLCPYGALAIEARPPSVIQRGLKKVDDEVSRHL
jgi:heterodisulfide reductase subunit A-like polyferredoxin